MSVLDGGLSFAGPSWDTDLAQRAWICPDLALPRRVLPIVEGGEADVRYMLRIARV